MKSDSTVTIRKATANDAAALLNIYEVYVRETAITFEYDVPSLEEFRSRIVHTLERYPYLVAEIDGAVAGYAYTGQFKDRAAYDWSVETSIYIDRSRQRCGIGRKLYEALEKISAMQNVLNMNACIAFPDNEDDRLPLDSVKFHENMGYTLVGEFHDCGCKFGRWYSMVWMEKLIGEHKSNPPAFISFPELDLSQF